MNQPILQIPQVADSLPRAGDFQATINHREIPVLDIRVGAVVAFAMAGPVTLIVRSQKTAASAVLRPLSKGIRPQVIGREIHIEIAAPGNFSLELDDDIKRPLFIFASPIREAAPPNPQDPNVIFLKAGQVHRFEKLELKSHQTLYFEPGAVLEAPIRATDAENIRILGAGIIDARYRENVTNAIKLTGCRKVFIQDIHMIDSLGWTLHPAGCDDVTIDNLKQTCWRANCDGIDVETCRKVVISNCFFLNSDDCIAVKTNDLRLLEGRVEAVDDVLVTKSVFWNKAGGNAMEVGFELSGTIVQNILFQNLHIEL